MRRTSGIVINNDIFINSSHVVKIEKIDTDKIKIDLSYGATPLSLEFKNESDRNTIFDRIIKEMYSYNFAYINFELK
jgi:hypothetical protein